MLLTAFMVCSCSHPNRRVKRDIVTGNNKTENRVDYTGFSVSYNPITLQPNWAEYTLTAGMVEVTKNTPNVPRHFMPDPNLKLPQASKRDYKGSGWQRGHMVRRQDMKWSKQALQECDYFTNVCPQDSDLNDGVWHMIENTVREVAKKYDSVHVVCGPIFIDTAYGFIGGNHIPVPDYFFKTLLIKEKNGYHTIAFVCPNSNTSDTPMDVMCTVDEAESLSGVDVFSYLPNGIEAEVEGLIDMEVWLPFLQKYKR